MKRKLKAVSLVETLVASAIFLTIFMIAMDAIGNLSKYALESPSPAEIELELLKCRKIGKGKYDYDWGVIEIDVQNYRDLSELKEVTLKAEIKNGRTIIYKYIAQESHEI